MVRISLSLFGFVCVVVDSDVIRRVRSNAIIFFPVTELRVSGCRQHPLFILSRYASNTLIASNNKT